ncbi:MAG TPA: Lrp/AsnC family transcriptional regulator [Pseudomonadales bacterium]|nr:Lrp/AsnC family transcriptional regulator [Pseudomonadales bacterium]
MPAIKLDKTDLNILDCMQRNAKYTTQEIADMSNMSQSPCWRRINRLEESGVIKKHVTLLDSRKLGFDLIVFATVNLTAQGRSNLEDFERDIQRFPEVVECYTMAGNWDYMLKIVALGIRQYEVFVREKLLQLDHVGEVHSHIAVTEIKNTTELPLELAE